MSASARMQAPLPSGTYELDLPAASLIRSPLAAAVVHLVHLECTLRWATEGPCDDGLVRVEPSLAGEARLPTLTGIPIPDAASNDPNIEWDRQLRCRKERFTTRFLDEAIDPYFESSFSRLFLDEDASHRELLPWALATDSVWWAFWKGRPAPVEYEQALQELISITYSGLGDALQSTAHLMVLSVDALGPDGANAADGLAASASLGGEATRLRRGAAQRLEPSHPRPIAPGLALTGSETGCPLRWNDVVTPMFADSSLCAGGDTTEFHARHSAWNDHVPYMPVGDIHTPVECLWQSILAVCGPEAIAGGAGLTT